LKVWQDWALAFNNKQVIMQCCRGLVQFWQNFQTSHVLLIPNCTHHRMITY
jgi:hypothetical protein